VWYLRDMCWLQRAIRAIALVAAVGVQCGCQAGTIDSVASSHTEANVPNAADFQRFLRRDLKAYLDRQTQRDLSIEYELLRQGPTQTGISYPKYYLWVKGFDANRLILDGAARVVAIEKIRFEVTDFLSRQDIRRSHASVEKTFPAALKAMILNKAGAA
jgi:hypothetical protein